MAGVTPLNRNRNNLYTFEFNGMSFDTRVEWRGDKPWFVNVDVCAALGYSNPSDVAKKLDDDEKDVLAIIDPHGQLQNTTIISRPGLFKILRSSRKAIAKAFDRWVRHEVLEEIVETGAYIPNQRRRLPRNRSAAWYEARIPGIDSRKIFVGILKDAGFVSRSSYRKASELTNVTVFDTPEYPVTSTNHLGEWVKHRGKGGTRNNLETLSLNILKTVEDNAGEIIKKTGARGEEACLKIIRDVSEIGNEMFVKMRNLHPKAKLLTMRPRPKKR